jgi:hypothetical protein
MSQVTSNKTALLALVVVGAALASFATVSILAAQKAFAGGHDDDCCDYEHHDHHGHRGHHHDHDDCDWDWDC